MRKLLPALTLLIVSFTIFSCQKVNHEPADNNTGNGGPVSGRILPHLCDPVVVDLIAGQNMNAGTVTVSNDETYIYVTYTTSNGWLLTQTHLYVGNCDLIPVNGAGNPIPGQFPYSSSHNYVTSYTYQVPVSAIAVGNCGCIAAHAVVVKLDAAGHVINQQTGWGNGVRINPSGGNWGMKFEFCSCSLGS